MTGREHPPQFACRYYEFLKTLERGIEQVGGETNHIQRESAPGSRDYVVGKRDLRVKMMLRNLPKRGGE